MSTKPMAAYSEVGKVLRCPACDMPGIYEAEMHLPTCVVRKLMEEAVQQQREEAIRWGYLRAAVEWCGKDVATAKTYAEIAVRVWRKTFLALCLCVSVAVPAFAATVTGTIRDPAGNGITGTLQLELSALGITGSELILIQPRTQCSITNGTVSMGCVVKGNDTITSPAGTFYCLRVLSANGARLTPKGLPYIINGASFDVGTAAQAAGKVCR